ncbi:MAG: methylated-DNA--[protein]-cysteine S-methyltransferase [Oscillospiraceae bacterium]|nr:methylated-DNA--[protein]-cysteine S-methyltransferase [Oscillospiraceae bacterium]
MIYTSHYISPLGELLLAGDDEGVTGLWFAQGGRYVGLGLSRSAVPCETEDIEQAKSWLDLYFAGRDPGPLPRLHLTGSAFRRRVGEILCEIPYGETLTYGQIAARIAKERGLDRMSAQAVGGAVGRNPICILVPCHRVVGADGSLTGYGGGILRKKALLELEGVDTGRFTVPKKGTAL